MSLGLKLYRFSILIRVLIGILFIYSSIPKIIDPIGFAMSIENYRILPPFLIKPCAYLLSYIILLLGIFLVFGFYKKITIKASLFLLFLFIIALTSTIVRGIDIECGCFKGAKLKAKAMFFLDLFLFFLLFYSKKNKL